MLLHLSGACTDRVVCGCTLVVALRCEVLIRCMASFWRRGRRKKAVRLGLPSFIPESLLLLTVIEAAMRRSAWSAYGQSPSLARRYVLDRSPHLLIPHFTQWMAHSFRAHASTPPESAECPRVAQWRGLTRVVVHSSWCSCRAGTGVAVHSAGMCGHTPASLECTAEVAA